MEQPRAVWVSKPCVRCTGDGVCRACKGSGRSGYFLRPPGPEAPSCPHCRGSAHCPLCRGSGQLIDWERSFRPKIRIETSLQVPTSISMAAITGLGSRSLDIPPEVLDLGYEEQRDWVGQRVRTHYKESGGRYPLFGEIVGYAWHYARGESLRFDTQGHFVEEV